MTLVTSAKDKQKLANQSETKAWIGMTGYYSKTTQNTGIQLLSHKGKTIGKSGKCKRKEKKKVSIRKMNHFAKYGWKKRCEIEREKTRIRPNKLMS